MADLHLAIAHHLAVFSLVAVFIAEFALVRPQMTARDVARVTRIDLWYGILAGVVVAIGVTRVYLGAKGAGYYIYNPFFWAKMACFAGAGLLSVPPTIRYLRWNKAARTDAARAPQPSDVIYVRRFMIAQGVLLAMIPVFAAAMARYSG